VLADVLPSVKTESSVSTNMHRRHACHVITSLKIKPIYLKRDNNNIKENLFKHVWWSPLIKIITYLYNVFNNKYGISTRIMEKKTYENIM